MSEPTQEMIVLSKIELQKVVREAVDEGVEQALKSLGLDTQKPLETQRDMAFLRDMRTGTQSFSAKAIFLAVAAAIVAVMGWAWIGYAQAVHKAGS